MSDDEEQRYEDANPRDPRQEATVTFDEVVEASVRAILLHEESKRRRPPEETAPATPAPRIKNVELAALIPAFEGHDDDAEQWLQRIDAVQTAYAVPDEIIQLVAVGKLSGQAQKWFHSRVEYATMPWHHWRQEFENMFDSRPNRIAMMKTFEARRWRKTERFATYCADKTMLGNRIGLEESDLINYIIDGFDDATLQSQARMREFTSLAELQRVMKNVTCEDRGQAGSTAHRTVSSTMSHRQGALPVRSSANSSSTAVRRCFNCNEPNHVAANCPRPKRVRGSCFQCGRMGHMQKDCRARENAPRQAAADTSTHVIDGGTDLQPSVPTIDVPAPAYTVPVQFRLQDSDKYHITVQALLDTGSPISLLTNDIVPVHLIESLDETVEFVGINGSKLNILGSFTRKIKIENVELRVMFYVVPADTLHTPCLLGRDVIMGGSVRVTFGRDVHFESANASVHEEFTSNEILLISGIQDGGNVVDLDIESTLDYGIKSQIRDLFHDHYLDPVRPDCPAISQEMKIVLSSTENPFYFRPRRLSFYEKTELNAIIQDLLESEVIRPSSSPYASPILLIPKKSGELRLCVDFRHLNKMVVKDRFPLPLVDDQLDLLRDKKFFTRLDLKSAFYHVTVEPESVKYLSFVTPNGQYEFLRAPFGFCNSPSSFMRYVNGIFQPLLEAGKLSMFFDDILIATETVSENLQILREVFDVLVQNLMTLRLDKCSFLKREIDFLGYTIDEGGVRPSKDNVSAVDRFPVPRNQKELHSFVGLVSYFRRFIRDFSRIAKPLFDLLRKDAKFNFGPKALEIFDFLKRQIAERPVLSVYSPLAETELHCDASSHGFGAILFQRQGDGKLHPVFFFSKRTTDNEGNYHSYELECLAIVYSVKRFHVYLHHIPFRIVTDCDSLRLTLEKKDTVPRIMRWAMFLQDYNYTIHHRSGRNMQHVDALSRCHNVLVLEENTFEQTLSIKQRLDPEINAIREQLEVAQLPLFESRNGLVYRKNNTGRLLFYVPHTMIPNIIRACHDEMGHTGVEKTSELISRTYWFPKIRETVKTYISDCLKCLVYQPTYGKTEGTLHSIPKAEVPFDTCHIDHYGPLEKCKNQDRYIFLVVDGFTKFVKLYACRTTNTKESIKHLRSYFVEYSRPVRVVSDRGSAFTSQQFAQFLENEHVQHVKIAVRTPRANGQVERENRTMGPMLAKLSEEKSAWNKHLKEVEFVINNVVSTSTGEAPSKLLFGVYQRGTADDGFQRTVDSVNGKEVPDLEIIRQNASAKIVKRQSYNAAYFDKHHKAPRKYQEGDFVLIANCDVTPGVNKKLIPKYKGPYRVAKVLPNDRYVINDIEDFQVTQIPYSGVAESSAMRPWLSE